jgi:FlaG/FlaF family flagellin (archaellin)
MTVVKTFFAKLKKLRLKVSKRTLIIAGGAAVILIIAIVLFVIALLNSVEQNGNQNSNYPAVIVPQGRSSDKLGNWEKSPSGDIYTYSDKISDIPVNVSEQPLPATFKTNTDTQMANFAKAQNATTTLAADKVTVYLGLSSKGPQWAIFAKQNLLVLIKATSKVNDDEWISYIRRMN